MLYGFPVSLITALGVMACPIGDVCEKVKKEFEHLKKPANLKAIDINKLKPSRKQIEEAKRRFGHLKENRASEEELKNLVNMNTSSYSLDRVFKMLKEYQMSFDLEKLTEHSSGNSSTKKVVFYLFSRSVPPKTVDNVFKSAKKLKGIKFYGVMLGIDKESIKYLQGIEGFKNTTIKINPLIFEAVGAEVVPAFVYAECPSGEFRSKLCDYKYVLYGDVSLEYAIEEFLKRERGND